MQLRFCESEGDLYRSEGYASIIMERGVVQFFWSGRALDGDKEY